MVLAITTPLMLLMEMLCLLLVVHKVNHFLFLWMLIAQEQHKRKPNLSLMVKSDVLASFHLLFSQVR